MREIEFTQFLRPNGRQTAVFVSRPDEIAQQADELKAAGVRLEAEVLTTGEVSMTCERTGPDGEVEDLSIRLCPNGPAVPAMIDELIAEATQAIKLLEGVKENNGD